MDTLREAQRLDAALTIAYRLLARRARTVAEIEAALAQREVSPATIAATVAELGELGYLDDAGYARRFAEDRRRLDGWGPRRIAQRLRELGVEPEPIEVALDTADTVGGELETAVALLRRRFAAPPAGPRERERARALLLRRGHRPETVAAALRRHAAGD